MPGLHAVAVVICWNYQQNPRFEAHNSGILVLHTTGYLLHSLHPPPPFPWEETNEFKTTVASLAPAPSTQLLTGGVSGGAAARRPCVHLVISLLCCITVFTPPHTPTPSPPSPAESSLINILHLPNELCQLELCAWLPACLVTFYRVECVWWGTWTWAQLPAFKCVPWSHASPISHITASIQLITQSYRWRCFDFFPFIFNFLISFTCGSLQLRWFCTVIL